MISGRSGTVYLIGAGPGDPGLLTLRGRELLAAADVVVYDRLLHPAVLGHTRPDAERIYVGKSSARHAMRQEEINHLIVDRAQQGQNVARLKGGDPFVFGRGGEEAEACAAAGVGFIVVPGVTSAIAAPAYAGIPVTHRDCASSFAVITGHERDAAGEAGGRTPGVPEQRRDWTAIANAADTLIFLMGVEALPEIAGRLQQHGRSAETPVALIEWGTWSRQRVVAATLGTIVERAAAECLRPPAVCVVGDVVALRETLEWFAPAPPGPLSGKRVLVTRAREQASALSDLLVARGAEPVEFPVIRIDRLDDYSKLDGALHRLGDFGWVAFTSANTAAVIAERLEAVDRDARAFAGVRIAAIGPGTAAALREGLRLRADFMPSEAVAEAAVAEWPGELHGVRVLLPRATEARDALPSGLAARGATVEVLPAYRTVLDGSGAAQVEERLRAGEIDAITFTSSSTVQNFVHALSANATHDIRTLIGSAVVAAIGPVTAGTACELGLAPDVVAAEHTIPGLVAAVERYFDAQSHP